LDDRPGAPYLTMLDFQKRAGIDMTYVPYRSTATALTDVAAGRIHLLTTSLTLAFPLVQEGTIKLLAVTTPERSKTVPDTPTASEAGHPELTVEAPLGLFGPKSISPDLRARIAADMQEAAQDTELVQRLERVGMVVRASTPAAYVTMLDQQRARWKEIARAYGLRPKQ
jgi:tripartite-type tricarboxylate transporter receptor subunit TctC